MEPRLAVRDAGLPNSMTRRITFVLARVILLNLSTLLALANPVCFSLLSNRSSSKVRAYIIKERLGTGFSDVSSLNPEGGVLLFIEEVSGTLPRVRHSEGNSCVGTRVHTEHDRRVRII